jgi:hypothetical protein
MNEIPWVIRYALSFANVCSVARLIEILKQMAANWPGIPKFPWRVTRNIHRFLGNPPVNFHYLMIHHCLMGCAAHMVLNAKFENRAAVLEMILREKVEIVGMLRVLLIDAIRAEVKRTGVPYIRDCSGPEDGHRHLPPDEIERRRQAFQACIEGAIADFVRILDVASLLKERKGEILGRSFGYWLKGGEMPEAVTLMVQVETTPEGVILKPCQEEVVKLLEAGRTVPQVLMEKRAEGRGEACPVLI